MTHNFTRMKVVSMTCEKSAAQQAIELMHKRGVVSIRTSLTQIEKSEDALSSVDLNESQLKLEFLVTPEALDPIVATLSKTFFNRYEVMFFVTDADVLRPELFYTPVSP